MSPVPPNSLAAPPQVALAGLGGLGAVAARVLTRAGVRVLAFEPDTVALSNLHRQVLYSRKHLNQPKAQVAAAVLGPNLTVVPHAFSPEAHGPQLAGCAIFMDLTDNALMKWTLEATPPPVAHLVIAGCLGLSGWVWRKPADNPHTLQNFFGPPDETLLRRTCAREGVLGPLVNWVGAVAAREALGLLGDTPPPGARLWRLTASPLRAVFDDFA